METEGKQMSTKQQMPDHVYRKLKKLYDGRLTVNGRDDYYRGLVAMKVSEIELVHEISRRLK